MNDRVIQIIAAILALATATASGALLPRMLDLAERHTLRYTDVAIDGAPPIVQLGTAVGALRGVIVNYLWLKVNQRKAKGLFYDIISDTELITQLQPRFAEVWAFHGHNLAYNLSVMTNTPQERWDWVNAGIRLVREEGLRYNPNDVVLHKELAFWLSHKIDGITDDAHWHYKREFAREWHMLLGPPPFEHDERTEWMRNIAFAPRSVAEAVRGRADLTIDEAIISEAIAELRFEVERVAADERRNLTLREARDTVNTVLARHRLTAPVQAEIRRLMAVAEDGRDALHSLQRVQRNGGVLVPGLAGEPAVETLIARLEEAMRPFESRFRFGLNKEFLINYGQWASLRTSPYAMLLGLDAQSAANNPVFAAFQEIAVDDDLRPAWRYLMAHLRRKVLIEEYNMDPVSMYEFTRDLGPLDWRHPQAHALYWARRGQQYGERRYENEDDIYKVLNNDRLQFQAMQALERSGIVSFDPFSNDNPGRLGDIRWIPVIDRYFRVLYERHYRTRGGGPDTFTHSHENFMKAAIRKLYRAGEIEEAQRVMEELDALYGRGGVVPHLGYTRPLDVFVQEITYGEYEQQPEVARAEVYAALQRGFREGLLLNRRRVLDDAIKFADDVTRFFRTQEHTDFVNKFGERRLGDLLGDLRTSARDVFTALLLDRSTPLLDRLTMFARAGDREKRMVYDEVVEAIRLEFEASPLTRTLRFEQIFPEPPGMEEHRAQRALERQRERDARRAEFERN